MKRALKENGFTYAELVICLVIIALVVGPICVSFTSANRVRATSQALNESITYTEGLMEAIKKQLTEDISLKKQKDGNQILSYPGGLSVTTGINLCLESTYDTPVGNIIGKAPLEEFLVDGSDIEKIYDTDRYAYEVAIWRTDNIDAAEIASTNTLEFKGNTLDRAAKLYSNSAYQLNSYGTTSANIKFKITDVMFEKLFEHQKYMESAVLDEYSIILTPGNLKDAECYSNTDGLQKGFSKGNAIEIDSPVLVKGASKPIGSLIYTLKEKSPLVSTTGTNIIKVDVRQLSSVGSGKFQVNENYDDLTLKFINNTRYNQIIKVIRNYGEGINGVDSIDKKVNIVAIDEGTGKSSIQRIEAPMDSQSFIIAIVTRDMKPVLGQPGKVVKKMIDVYSYETGNN